MPVFASKVNIEHEFGCEQIQVDETAALSKESLEHLFIHNFFFFFCFFQYFSWRSMTFQRTKQQPTNVSVVLCVRTHIKAHHIIFEESSMRIYYKNSITSTSMSLFSFNAIIDIPWARAHTHAIPNQCYVHIAGHHTQSNGNDSCISQHCRQSLSIFFFFKYIYIYIQSLCCFLFPSEILCLIHSMSCVFIFFIFFQFNIF